jgi:glyoxylase-like metal-dependent hydrolase (beta-lactamase superfamily II)
MWCSKTQWDHSKISNPREQAAYNSEVLNFINDSGKLNFVENEGELFPNFDVKFFDGHTPGQMIPFINVGNKTFVYTSDLVPTAANIPLLWIASYDLDPVKVMDEKEKFLDEVVEKDQVLFFEHDYFTECATVKKTEKGYMLNEKYDLVDLI